MHYFKLSNKLSKAIQVYAINYLKIHRAVFVIMFRVK